MRFRAADNSPPRLGAAADVADPRLVRMLHGVSARARRRRLVGARADLGAKPDAESTPTVGAGRPVLGDGPGIFRHILRDGPRAFCSDQEESEDG